MANLDLAGFIEDLLASWFKGGQSNITAVQIQDAAADAGYDPKELDNLDWADVYNNACNQPGVPAEYKGQMGSAPGGGQPTIHTVVREVQQVTEVHNYNTQILDNSTTIDQSLNVDGDLRVEGEGGFHYNPVAADDGSAAAGGNQQGVAVGENATASGTGPAQNASGGGIINNGPNTGNQSTGDGSSQIGGTTFDDGYGGGKMLGENPPATKRLTEEEEPPGDGGHGGDGGGIPGLPGYNGPIIVNTGPVGGDLTQHADQHNEQHNERHEEPEDPSPADPPQEAMPVM